MARVVAASQPSRMARHDRAEVLAAPRSAAPTGCASAAVRAPPSSSASVISSLAFAATASHRRGRPRRLAPVFFSALRRAPPFHLPCRHGPRADRRRARCQEPQLYHRGRCRDRRSRCRGVLIAHGDATSGYSLYIKNGHLVHDLNIGGGHEIVRSQRRLPSGAHRLVVYVERPVRKPTACQRRAHGGERIHAADRRRTCGCAQD